MSFSLVVPAELAATHRRVFGSAEWIDALPRLAGQRVAAWDLRLDGAPRHGMVALVLPVLRADGTPAVLKLQPVTDDTVGEPVGLRAWAGRGAVRLLEHDPASGSMLLERLQPRSLADVDDDLAALRLLSELLARLSALPAPTGLRRLADIAAAMLTQLDRACARLADPGQQRLLRHCAGAVADLLDEPGDQLLHWDLHYENVLAGQREPWLAIDPQPMAGDPGFELLPALDNRWDDIVATGDITAAVRRRFAVLVETLGLDRQRAAGWTLGRVLQNCLWDIDDGATTLDAVQVAIAQALVPLGP
ncbi:aminoglycoside phosphotransferase family protein [Saccharopolyspora sp. K220]|uniref:aminoglycoside phosphotransferase family protein n=1 Tax=Saccharopolyspora soli TaxID=2926618 RepID=UPI001F58D87F|nr:aminoglycoside phosphotransferase family protein [Saccharopolyspora soli]MCI2417201.1 aminoglycoside phosphotransferase family protein [Saccharopolyspora soli]